jgi:hypothetical protein
MPAQNFNILTGLNVGNITANATANSLSTSGNITAGNLSSTGNLLTVNFSALGLSNLGNIGNVQITGGANAQVLTTDGTGNLYWSAVDQSGTVNSGTATQLTYYAAHGNTVSETGANLTWNGSNLLSVTGNITVNQVTSTATAAAPFVVNSTELVANLNANLLNGFTQSTSNTANTLVLRDASGNISAVNIAGTLTTAAQPNITSVGSLSSLTVTGNASFGNIDPVTGTLAVTGNIYGGNFETTGKLTVFGNAAVGNLTATLIGGTLTTAAQPNITTVGTLSSVTVSGNATVGNLVTGNLTLGLDSLVSTYHTITLEPAATGNTGNVIIQGNLEVTGSTNILTGAKIDREVQIVPSSQTVFTLGNISYITGTETLSVYLDGVRQHPASYTETNSNTVTFTANVAANTSVLFEVINPVQILGGANTNVLYNANGSVTGSANLTFDGTRLTAAALTVDTSTLYVDPVNDRVGVGNTSPSHTLRVEGTLSASGNADVGNIGATNSVVTANATFGNINNVSGILSVTGNANVGNISATNANIATMTATGNVFLATSGGAVGIGTATPGGARLHVYSLAGNTGAAIKLQNLGVGDTALSINDSSGTNRFSISLFSTETVTGLYGNNADVWIGSNTNGTTPTKAFAYFNNTTENVGIGTATPGTKLEVFGSITARAATTQDSVILAGRAGGTAGYGVTITPTTLTASRTVTLANGDTTLAAGTMAVTGGTLAQFAATTSSQLAGVISDETGSGSLVFATSPTLVTPLLGTPTSGTLTNCTGYPVANIANLGSGVATFLATPSSANLASAVTDETGSGALVFATSPTIATPTITTSAVIPIVNGGTTASSTLTLQSTSGAGTTDAIIFKTASQQERMRINSAGDVLVGSATDAGNSLRYLDIYNTNTGSNAGSIMRLISSDDAGISTAVGQIVKYKNGAMLIQNSEPGSNGLMLFYVGASERVRITSTGNVGIGTSTVSAKLHVTAGDAATANGQLIISGGRSLGTVMGSAGGILFSNSYWNSGFGAAGIYGGDNGSAGGNLMFATLSTGGGQSGSPSERMRIDSSGNVGIGTTSPGTKLHVGAVTLSDGNVTLSAGTNMVYATATSGAALTWNANTNGGNANTIMAQLKPRQDTSANYNLDVFCGAWNNNNTPGTAIATFSSSGNVGIGTTSPSYKLDVTGDIRATGTMYAAHFDNVSDISLKTNIKPITNSLDIIKQLNPVSFNWKDTDQKSFGLIAQEVEKILPELVKFQETDNIKTVSYIQLISLLIDAVKEQQKQIDNINNSA